METFGVITVPYLVSRVAKAVEGTSGYNFTIKRPRAFYPVKCFEIEKLFKVPRTDKDWKRVEVKVRKIHRRSYGLHLLIISLAAILKLNKELILK